MGVRVGRGLGWKQGRVYWVKVPKYFTEQDAQIYIQRMGCADQRRPGLVFRVERLAEPHRARVLGQIFHRYRNETSLIRRWFVFSEFPIHAFLPQKTVDSLKRDDLLKTIRVPKISECSQGELDFWFHGILEQESKKQGKIVKRISVAVAEHVEQGVWKFDRLGLRAWIHQCLSQMRGGVLR